VNRRALERQLDELLPLFASWGVAGVKYGFVNVHTQSWTAWLYEAIRKAGQHRLMLDIHDEFRPTGLSRTYPHLLTQEGILGNEGLPDATHSTILPFTRMLAGAGDYTFCWLDNRLKNTWGHQLAMTVAIYSPLQFMYWYDRPVNLKGDSPGFTWISQVPTTWDETRVLAGKPGEMIAIARKKDAKWYLGVVGNNDGGAVQLRLDMLEPDREWQASLYADGDGPKDITVREIVVRAGDVLPVLLQPRGGMAAVFTPVQTRQGRVR
jgi:alpha-glucosidase